MKDTLIDKRYLVLGPLGSGGEARVFRARDTTTGNDVALRVSREKSMWKAPASLPPFHDGWVRLLDSGSDAVHGPYQVLELLEGMTLSQLIEHAPLDRKEWLVFVNASLNAVEALHHAGWIHSDLSAENLFRLGFASTQWKLLELPFLHFSPATGRSTLFGNIHTLAPERFEGAPADVRSDLYSLGSLYYFAASGHYPHTGETNQEVAINCLRFPPAPLQEKARHLPASWCAWVMTLLERHPQKRFPTASAAHHLLAIA